MTTTNAAHQGSRGRSSLGGRAIALGVGGAVVALILQLIFIGSYVGALHDPSPHDVPIGIVVPAGEESSVVAEVGAGGRFRAIGYADDAALRHAIDQLTVYGGIELTPQGAHLLVSDASSATAASAVTTFGQGFASGQNLPLSVEHVHPLGGGDPRGLTPVYLMIAWVFGGYFAAIVISQVRGTGYTGRVHALLRVALLIGYAVASGLTGSWLVTGPIGAIDGHFWTIAWSGMLIVFAVAAFTGAAQLLVGLLGTLIVLISFVLVGNPAAGGIAPLQFLPGFWRAVGPWLPNASAYELLRNGISFDGAAIGRSLLVLAIYALIGAVIMIVFAPYRSPLGTTARGEDAAALAAAGASAI